MIDVTEECDLYFLKFLTVFYDLKCVKMDKIQNSLLTIANMAFLPTIFVITN